MAPGRIILEAPTELSLENKKPSSRAVDLGGQGQALPLVLPREACTCLSLSSLTLSSPHVGLPAPFPSSQSHSWPVSLLSRNKSHFVRS